MIDDEREAWEIAYSLWCQVAASYLAELDIAQTDPALATVYATAYRVENGGGLAEWAEERISKAISRANTILATHGGKPITVPSVEPNSLARLTAMGLRGSAGDAATVRTNGDVTAQ